MNFVSYCGERINLNLVTKIGRVYGEEPCIIFYGSAIAMLDPNEDNLPIISQWWMQDSGEMEQVLKKMDEKLNTLTFN